MKHETIPTRSGPPPHNTARPGPLSKRWLEERDKGAESTTPYTCIFAWDYAENGIGVSDHHRDLAAFSLAIGTLAALTENTKESVSYLNLI